MGMMDDLLADIAPHTPQPSGIVPPSSKTNYLTPAGQTSLVDSLASGWIDFPQFRKADASIKWLDIEREFEFPLDDHTILVGKIDAIGQTENGQGDHFFGEWKTSAPPPRNKREEWKQTWRMNPQSLTYGVAGDRLYPGMRRFTVRKAFKSSPPSFDWEWFAYTTEEIKWWESELILIADEIRRRRRDQRHGPWAPNFDACFKFGVRYACPFFAEGCSKLNWRPVDGLLARESHLENEKRLIEINTGSLGQKIDKQLVILDASRVGKWSNCRERYRRQYEDEGQMEPEGEALAVGTGFHDMMDAYYRKLRGDDLG